MKRLVAVIFCASMLGGCVTTGTQQITVYSERLTRGILVHGFNEVPSTALKLDDVTPVALGPESSETSSNYTIKLGDADASFVKVYRLPAWTAPYSLQLMSFVFGGLSDPAIFYPRYAFLDKDFKVVRQSDMGEFVYRGAGPQGAIAADVFVNEENRSETYVAIYGEPRRSIVEQTSVMQSSTNSAVMIPVKGGALMWFISTGGLELPKPMRAAAGGNLQIKMSTYKPKRIGEGQSTPRGF